MAHPRFTDFTPFAQSALASPERQDRRSVNAGAPELVTVRPFRHPWATRQFTARAGLCRVSAHDVGHQATKGQT